MTFPALDEFEDDPKVTPARYRVYTFLRKHYLTVEKPLPVKISSLERRVRGDRGAHIHRNLLIEAVNWLVGEGYLIEHGRDGRVRLLSLAFRRSYAERTNSAAA